MANRHERRKRVKLMNVETIRGEDLCNMRSMCAWEGCNATTDKPHKHGWSSMLLYKGKPQLNFMAIDEQQMARDCVLCPEHARYLDEHLLVDIGGQLREAIGSA